MWIVWILAFIINGCVMGFVCNKVIYNRGYDENWFWWGFFFSWLTIVIALSKQENHSEYIGETYLSGYGNNNSNTVSDWRCYNCMTLNPGYVGTCKCGATREDSISKDAKVSTVKEVPSETYKRMKANKESQIIDMLERYKQLLDSGSITEEEFNTKKKELLT